MTPAELYAAHLRVLQRFVYYRLPTRADAGDVLQEIALAALSAREAPEGEEKGKAWLLGIARHKCADWFRRADKALPLEALLSTPAEPAYTHTRVGLDVRDCLSTLNPVDRQVLALTYLEGRTQAEIAEQLGIPTGTVKSRLHTAKAHFRENYDDEMECVGRASVHGIEGVALTSYETNGGQHEAAPRNDDLTRTFIAQLTDTHVRLLAESHVEDGVRRCYTFLDGDAFLDNWGFGEDNCGKEIHLAPKGIITREGDTLRSTQLPAMDVVGRYAVTLGGRRWDTICLIDLESYETGVCTERFIDQNGRTVLWRRFNHNDWNKKNYGGIQWTEKLPGNQRLTINGETYVHWYDCITEYAV
ncbi:MAG: RNA polymerase sigma factor [Oscillospiraceae bacterium]|jgi:RNA polymerase sigma factor (sigma-70 family)|nr:RNA polymerase sigma factor [Oscillospiraceae bacterium]